MPRNYEIHRNDAPLDPPAEFDNYSDAVTEMMRMYDNFRWIGYTVTPIINAQFTYYLSDDDGEDGFTYEIVKVEKEYA